MTPLFLVDRCETERRLRSTQPYGGKQVAQENLQDEPCRYIEKTQRGQSSITGEWIVTTVYQMGFRHSADVQEGDRITNVRLQDGTFIGQDFEVDGGAIGRRGRMATIKIVNLKKAS